MACDPVVAISRLTKIYPGDGAGRPALSEVSLELLPGEALGLVGRNGAGKTTLLSCILGFLRPTSGDIRVLGHRPADPRSRATIGWLSEDNPLYSTYTVDGILDLIGDLRSIRLTPQKKRDLLASVGLDEIGGARVGRLSKGTRQRLGIALANIGDPKFLVMDEPLTGLDPVSRQMILDLMRAFTGEGRTIIFCSHMLDDVARVCSRICVLRRGEIALDGPMGSPETRSGDWVERVLATMGS